MEHTRRTYLASTGAVAVGSGLAGCLGGSPAANTSHSCELTDRQQVSDLPQPRLGPDDAAVTVAVFEDFACPHCRDFTLGPFADLKAEFGGDSAVAFEHYDFPLPVSDWSRRVANAARSVQDATDDATFFEFAAAAYENQADYTWQLVGDIAEGVGVDPCRALSAATYKTYEPVIEANRQEGQDRNISGTPTVFVNGQLTTSTYDAIATAIESSR